MSMRISKTKFIAGCQCLKRLYLQVHEPELAAEPDGAVEAIIEQGREVGMLARQLFPGGVEVRSDGGLGQAMRTTEELISNPEIPAIFEGAFEHEGVIVKTDVLQRRKENVWRLVEVKSASDLKDQYVKDVAIQSYVLSGSGLKLASVWVAHINRAYVLTGTTVDPPQLFSFRNLTTRREHGTSSQNLSCGFGHNFRFSPRQKLPSVPAGLHCINPVVCEFFNHCNTPKPHDHIGYLPRIDASKLEKLEKMGIQSIQDIPADF